MNTNKIMITLCLVAAFVSAACGGAAEPTPEPKPTEVVAEPTEVIEVPTATPTNEPEPTEAEAMEEPTLESTEEPEPEPEQVEMSTYDGPITEIAIRQVAIPQVDFVAAREAYIAVLQQQEGVVVDRELRAFLDFSTFGAPQPAVFIGMTEYENAEAFGNASGAAGGTEEAGAFFSSFDLEIFGALRPVNPEDRYDLAELGIGRGQVIEVAARDLSSYENFDSADYETKRDIFLEALSQQSGFVREYQWVSILDENIAVGMTVYESVEAYVAINSSDFVNTPEYTDFVFTYPFVAGYANYDAKPSGVTGFDLAETVAFPESIAVNDSIAYVSNFFDGSIHTLDLTTGDTSELVAAGVDSVAAGWGLWYDHPNDVLYACTARNAFGGPAENLNAAKAIDPATGETLEIWDLPDGALCNSLVVMENGDIYISDVSPNADVIKIDRASGQSSVWVNEPAWENDSGFGLGGLAWDGDNTLYVSAGGPLIRIDINEDGTPADPVVMTLLDSNGNALPALAFDGFSYSQETGKMYGASFNFDAFQSSVTELTIMDDTTVQTGKALAGPLGVTGIDAHDGNVYAADGQIIQALFVEGYASPAPFQVFEITE